MLGKCHAGPAAVLVALGVTCWVLLPSVCSGFGLGIVAGEPTGVSFKQWLSGPDALDGAVAWSFGDDSALHIHVDYLYHTVWDGSVRVPGWKLYIGVGGRLKLVEDDNRLGARVPFGVTYLFRSSPFDFFLEVAPILDLAPATELRMNGGVGIRFYFGQPWQPDLLT